MVRESTSGRQNCGISDGRLRTARATTGFETFLGKEEISGGPETIREDCPDCSRNFRSIEIESELNAPCTLRVLKEPSGEGERLTGTDRVYFNPGRHVYKASGRYTLYEMYNRPVASN